jgi:hypothetical protein
VTLDEVLQQVRVGDAFYRTSKPEIIYERIGALIERNGLGWATLCRTGEWDISGSDSELSARDWTVCRNELQKDFDSATKAPMLHERFSERTRNAWTLYDDH